MLLGSQPVVATVPDESILAASGTWTDEHTFQMIWQFTETPHYDQVTCRMEGEALQLEFRKSLVILNASTKEDRPVLTGRLAR